MVYIRRIDIKGFKTFKRKASINLGQGLTVVTGPNGSGKSNIMDAVKFAMGELSPKELRGGAFDDLISKSSPTESAKSAYVAIQFENKDRRIPIDSDHVTISREFVRKGEGIYRVNGKRVSRKRINDALLSAGLTLSGLNVVPQHTITRLADTTPEERRRIIEDMVGIGIYDSKKEEALNQLQQADINVKIATARVEEVRHHIRSLEEERNKLLRSRYIRSEVKSLNAQLISTKIKQLEEESNEFSKYYESLAKKLSELRMRRRTLQGKKEPLEAERNRLEKAIIENESDNLLDLEKRINEALAEKAELAAEIDATRQNVEYLEKQINNLETTLSNSEERINEVNSSSSTLKDRRETLLEKLGSIEAERSELTSEILKIRERHSNSFAEIDIINKRIDEMMKTLNLEESNYKSTLYKTEILSDDIQNLNRNREELITTLSKVTSKISEMKDLVKSKLLKKREISTRIHEMEKLRDRNSYHLDRALQVAERTKLIILNQDTSTKASLGSGIILEAATKGLIQGVIGRLNDLISIPDFYRPALETASNGWLDAIIVNDLDSAIDCLNIVRTQELSSTKIIPLSEISKLKSSDLPLKYKVIKAEDLINSSPEIKPAIKFVLGDTMVTESRREAFLLSLKGIRSVSVQGDLFEPEGGMIVGDYRSTHLLPLDIDTLKGLLEKLESSIERGNDDLKSIKEELERLTLESTKFNGVLAIHKRELNSIEEERKKLSNEVSRLDESIRDVERQKRKADETVKTLISRVKSLRNEINLFTEKRSSLMTQIQDSTIKETEEKASKIEVTLEELRKELGKIESELSGLDVSEDILTKNIERLTEEGVEARKSVREQTTKIGDLNNKLRIISEELEDLMARRKKVTSSMFRLKEESSNIESELKLITDELEKTYEEVESTSSKYEELSSSIKNIDVEKAVLARDLRSLGYDNLPPIEGYNDEFIEQLKTTLEDELRTISAVNELALEQYTGYTSNYKGLSIRINELEKERKTILIFMEELDSRKRETFMQAFLRVDASFQGIFSKLAGGGSGRLVLEDLEDPFKGGLEILLAFPGKAEFSISGASGGEKSLATVCFTLSLQEINPMPFYMFDEIDAHLDVWNSQRLADLLKERSKGSQFILISLKDSTVAKADQVYGVYIEGGFSNIVALPRGEIAA